MSKNVIIGIVALLLLAVCGLGAALFLMLNQEKPVTRKPLPRYSELIRASKDNATKSKGTSASAVPGRYTREILSKLELGMSPAEVQAILRGPGEKMNFPSAPADVASYRWDTRFPSDIVITFKNDKVVGISSPRELTPGMIAPGTDSKAAPKLVYLSSMVKSAFARWDTSKGQLRIVAYGSALDGTDEDLASRVFPRMPKDREKGALFELQLKMPEGAKKPTEYRFTLFKQSSWPAVYSCDICGLMSKKGRDAQQQIQAFSGEAEVGSTIALHVVGKSREPMFEDSIHARWDLDFNARVLIVR